MSLAAGRLRHRVSLQQQVQTQNPVTGSVSVSWVEVAEVWCAIEPMSAREFIAAQAMQSNISERLVIRYRPDVRASWRAVDVQKGTIYNIHGALADKDYGNEYLTLPVSTGTNDGQ